MERSELSIIIDERQDQLDAHTARTLFCAVEVPKEIDVGSLSQEVSNYIDKNKITDLDKLHFASMNHDQRRILVDLIGKMDIAVKIYIYYDFRVNNAVSKRANLIKSVRATQYKHRNKKLTFYVEYADEYKGIIKKDSLTIDHFLSLIADCYCYIFAAKLNNPRDEFNNESYLLLRHQMRLNTYVFGGQKFEDSRSSRI